MVVIFYIGLKGKGEKISKLLADQTGMASIETAGAWVTAADDASRCQPKVVIIDMDSSLFCWNLFAEFRLSIAITTYFIGITTCPLQAYKGFKNGFHDVILSPWMEEDLHKMTVQCVAHLSRSLKILYLKNHREYYYLKLKDITHLRADNNTTDFHLTKERVVTAFKTLKTFETRLPSQFVRVNKSYIINLNHIYFIDTGKKCCKLRWRQQAIPLSKKYILDFDVFKRKIQETQT